MLCRLTGTLLQVMAADGYSYERPGSFVAVSLTCTNVPVSRHDLLVNLLDQTGYGGGRVQLRTTRFSRVDRRGELRFSGNDYRGNSLIRNSTPPRATVGS